MFSIKMIKNVWFLIILININILAQDPILKGLDNPDPLVRINTLYRIQNEMLIEYVPKLMERMFNQAEPYIVYEYMRTLFALNSNNDLSPLAYEFIGFANNFPDMQPPDDPLRAQVFATHILFTLGDYSTVDYAFEILNRDFSKVNADAQDIMVLALKNVPQLRDQAKIELLRMINNCNDNFIRFYSISALKEYYGTDIIAYLLDWFENDIYYSIRMQCLTYLFELNYQQINNLLKNRLSQDSYWVLRVMIADSLLTNFGKPSDLKAVIDYQPNEPDETARSLMDFSIRKFIPPRPEIPTAEMIQNLRQYIEELYSYGWIGEESHYQEYLGLMERIEGAYNEASLEDLCENLNAFLDYVEQNNYRPALTIEGYKFLHYHATYIKENVENEFGPCE